MKAIMALTGALLVVHYIRNTKPYCKNDGPSIFEILIHDIDAALVQLQD